MLRAGKEQRHQGCLLQHSLVPEPPPEAKLEPVAVNDHRIGGAAGAGPPLAALQALLYATQDDRVVRTLRGYEEEWGVTLPADLKTITAWPGIADAVTYVHPGNNDYCVPTAEKPWRLLRVAATGEHAVKIMDERGPPGRAPRAHQCCCYWFAAWHAGAESSRVYVSDHAELYGDDGDEDAGPQLTAESLAGFLADYAKSGHEDVRQAPAGSEPDD